MKTVRPLHSLAIVGILGVLMGLAGAPNAITPPPVALGALAGPGATTFLVAGDSITAAGSRNVSAGHIGATSWINFVNPPGAIPQLGWSGGWALGGAQSGDMSKALRHGSADTLVILAGTNDLARQTPYPVIARNLLTLTRIVSTTTVLVSSVPPRDDAVAATLDYNRFLELLAADEGWVFVDASAGLRTPEGMFKSGLSDDGVHPNLAGAAILGHAIGEALTDIPLQATGPLDPATT